MIFAVRLRPHNKKIGHGLRRYTSFHNGTTYTLGEVGQSPPFKIVTDPKELRELREYPQFEMIPFENREELNEFVEKETMQAAHRGISLPKPVIHEAEKAGETNRSTETIFGDDPEAEEEVEELTKELGLDPRNIDPVKASLEEGVSAMQEKYDEAVELNRTEYTLQKWKGRLEEAQKALEEYAPQSDD